MAERRYSCRQLFHACSRRAERRLRHLIMRDYTGRHAAAEMVGDPETVFAVDHYFQVQQMEIVQQFWFTLWRGFRNAHNPRRPLHRRCIEDRICGFQAVRYRLEPNRRRYPLLHHAIRSFQNAVPPPEEEEEEEQEMHFHVQEDPDWVPRN